MKNTNYVQLSPDETFLNVASISFDAAVFEIWGALLNGACLVLFPSEKPSLEELGQVLCDQGVTTLFLTTGLFQQMVDHRLDDLRGVRQLLVRGEVMPVLQLPTDRPKPPVQTFRGAIHRFVIHRRVTEACAALSQQEGATLFMKITDNKIIASFAVR